MEGKKRVAIPLRQSNNRELIINDFDFGEGCRHSLIGHIDSPCIFCAKRHVQVRRGDVFIFGKYSLTAAEDKEIWIDGVIRGGQAASSEGE